MPSSESVPRTDAPGECRAVVDIGTNSVKLLVARVDGFQVEPLLEKGNQTRLGEGFFATHRLQPAAIERTVRAVTAFRDEAIAFRPARFRVLATAAAREAENRADLLEALAPVAGTSVEVISGELEADLAFRGVCTLPGLGNHPLLVADVGGGSTELIVGQSGRRRFGRSFPLGAVRLMETLRVPENPRPEDLDHCRQHLDAWVDREVRPGLRDALPRSFPDGRPGDGDLEFVGVGGTAAVLACMVLGLERFDRSRIEAARLDPATLAHWTSRLWSLPLSERRRIPGLPAERADVILTGSAIYEALVRAFGLAWLRPSTRGLRFAALLDAR